MGNTVVFWPKQFNFGANTVVFLANKVFFLDKYGSIFWGKTGVLWANTVLLVLFGENTVVSGATTVVDYSGIWDKYHFICGGGMVFRANIEVFWGKYRGI